MNKKRAINAIERAGILLVFPMDNRKEPASLWSHFFPKRKMRWEWDESGDNAVAELWQLRGDLSTTRQVIYTKWYRGRATYFSKSVFELMLRAMNENHFRASLSDHARKILDILETESPLSTKELKRQADLRGRANERIYEKALQELWGRLLIVAFGEVDEGAFPSLAVGSTRVLFEDIWNRAFRVDRETADISLSRQLPAENVFYQQYLKLRARVPAPVVSRARKLKAGPMKSQIPAVVRFEDL